MLSRDEVYTSLLTRELLVSQGCTEPAAIAYAAALCRRQLGVMPERIRVSCSGNLFKNAKSAKLPNTDSLQGIAAAAVAGTVGGDPDHALEVLDAVTPSQLGEINRLLASSFCEVALLNSGDKLHIIAEGFAGKQSASVEIVGEHTHIARIVKNGAVVAQDAGCAELRDFHGKDLELLNMRDICLFAESADLSGELGRLLRSQLTNNVKICEEGMRGHWGSAVGRLLSDGHEGDVERMACAFAAAGSDARMSGCALPVVINSGSGNQGITVTAPVYIYAKKLGADEDKLLRALIISNLFSIYQKSMIGRLSAYCGAVSAACGAGAAITYLNGGSHDEIANAFANAAAIVSGILCDGAKPSCAAKIASAVNAAILGYKMAVSGNSLKSGDGIVGSTPDGTVRSVGKLAREGLVDIDRIMLGIMFDNLSSN